MRQTKREDTDMTEQKAAMAWEAKRALFDEAKAIAEAPTFATLPVKPGVKPTTFWETKLLPSDTVVSAFHENVGRGANTGIPVVSNGKGKVDEKATRSLCDSIKGRIMKVRKGESWAVTPLDGFLFLSDQGAVISRGKTGAARKVAEAATEAPATT